MRVLGMISGTSHDGIDCAVVRFTLEGSELEARVEYRASIPYSAALRSDLLQALPPAAVDLSVVTQLDTRIGQEFADAAVNVIAAAGAVDLICSHGQTVFHWVSEGKALGSLQLGQPAWIAERTGAPVVADVRLRDIAAGGQGAPLVPILDMYLLSDLPGVRAALNLGGISNATIVSGEAPPLAFDIGPANALIDAAVKLTDAHPDGYDAAGAIAASGTVNVTLLRELLAEPYYAEPAPKTTGKELFHVDYVRQMIEHSGVELEPADLIATLTELTAVTTADALRKANVGVVIASGGGAHNLTLMDALRRELPGVNITTTWEVGLESDTKEAFAFALIGWLTWHGLPSSVPAATGAGDARILGSITPGSSPLRLPEPLLTSPAKLTIVDAVTTVRVATDDDHGAIQDVFYDCWTISYPEVLPRQLIGRIDREAAGAMWERALADTSGTILVAHTAKSIVGVTGFAMKDAATGHIRSLYVSPNAQGEGIGRKLVDAAVNELESQGAEIVTLWVFEENWPSRNFYERLGWYPDGERMIDEEFGEPQIRLSRVLS